MPNLSDKPGGHGILWPRLFQGTLIRRYQRFKADVKLRNGSVVTAHCPNSGSMQTCCEPERTVYLSRSANPARKLKYTWEMIEMPSSLVGVNTSIPNRLVERAVLDSEILELLGYGSVRREVWCSPESRLDLLLESPDRPLCFVEIKNCTLVEDRVAYFPDAVTSRGLKHLAELRRQVALGNRAVMFFLIQRMDADSFSPADLIDPAYGQGLRSAKKDGVEILAYDVALNLTRIALNSSVPFEL